MAGNDRRLVLVLCEDFISKATWPKRPASLPAKGCDFGLTTHENEGTFGAELLCRSSNDGWLTVSTATRKV